MDNLKKWSEKQRSVWDSAEPPVNELWDAISDNLDKEKGRVVSMSLRSLMKYAAALAFIVVSGFVYMSVKISNARELSLGELSPELAETEFYYHSKLEEKMNALKANSELIDPSVMSEIEEMDSVYKDLLKDLKDDADNEEVIMALIENYRLRLQLLEGILSRLNKDHEIDENKISI